MTKVNTLPPRCYVERGSLTSLGELSLDEVWGEFEERLVAILGDPISDISTGAQNEAV